MTTETTITLQVVSDRIAEWFEALDKELGLLRERFHLGHDSAAESFVQLIQDVLAEQRVAFERYKANTAASEAVRLRWFQQLGGEVARQLHRLERLDGAMPPRTSPLVSAFVRMLRQLIPGRAAVITPFRKLNYEIASTYSEPFEPYGIDLTKHHFPALFIRIPTGFLDSPRNHILIAHELGHAVAAEYREAVARYAREAKRAAHLGQPAPPNPPKPLIPTPQAPRHRLEQIATKIWSQRKVPVPPPPAPGHAASPERAQYAEMLSLVTNWVQKVASDWLEELFADAVGIYLLGPAFVFTVVDILLPLGEPEDASSDHPPTATRLVNLRDALDAAELSAFATDLPKELWARIEGVTNEARSAIGRIPGTGAKGIDADVYRLAHELALAEMPAARKVAYDYCLGRALLYTPAQFKDDLAMFVDDMVTMRIPPLGEPPQRNVSLATVFNVAQVVAQGRLAEFCPGDPIPRKLQLLDNLILKAVELAEVQHAWETAAT